MKGEIIEKVVGVKLELSLSEAVQLMNALSTAYRNTPDSYHVHKFAKELSNHLENIGVR